MKVEVLAQPFGATVGDRLIAELSSGRWQRFRCAVAFAKCSGVQYLDEPLRKFVKTGGMAELAIGIDSGGTSFEAASHLASAVGPTGQMMISHELRPSISFHPKLYAFTSADPLGRGLIISGSSNITEGGLFTNHELSTAFALDARDPDDAKLLADFCKQLDVWQDLVSGMAVTATGSRLLALYEEGRLLKEMQISRRPTGVTPASHLGGGTNGLGARRRKPPKPKHRKKLGSPLVPPPSHPPRLAGLPAPAPITPGPVVRSPHKAFYIDIDTANSKTEIYLSKVALKEDPAFFRHPFTGLTIPKRGGSKVPQPELQPRPIVDIHLLDKAGAAVPGYSFLDHRLKVWEYANGKNAKHELRITIPAPLLHRLPKGCILEMRRDPVRTGIDYKLDFLTPGSAQWLNARVRASTALPNSPRKRGWG
jgi:HKD family nuclease